MLNHITIMGRLVADPELRRTGSGVPVASFRIACERDFASKDRGERKADFINCVAWRRTGEVVSEYFSKGRMIVVDGRLEMRDWTDKDGNKRTSAEINVGYAYFGDSKKSDSGMGGNYADNYGGNYAGSYPGSDGGYGMYPPPGGGYTVPYGGDFEMIEEDDKQLPF